MSLRTIPLVLFLVALSGPAVLADTGIPFVGMIELSTYEEVSLLVYPDGSGPPLSGAKLFGGATVDATITVVLVDLNWDPIANFPLEDIWLDPENAGTHQCFGGFTADHHTDANGQTTFATSLAGGGWSEGPVYVYLNGDRARYPNGSLHSPVPLRINSPDLNNDRVVNLSDVAIFAADYFGPYHYRSDLYWDGVLSLTDLVKMIEGYGTGCD